MSDTVGVFVNHQAAARETSE